MTNYPYAFFAPGTITRIVAVIGGLPRGLVLQTTRDSVEHEQKIWNHYRKHPGRFVRPEKFYTTWVRRRIHLTHILRTQDHNNDVY